MSQYRVEDLYGATGTKGLSNISTFLKVLAIIILPIAIALVVLINQLSYDPALSATAAIVIILMALLLLLTILLTLPFINALKTLVIASVKSTLLLQELAKNVKELKFNEAKEA